MSSVRASSSARQLHGAHPRQLSDWANVAASLQETVRTARAISDSRGFLAQRRLSSSKSPDLFGCLKGSPELKLSLSDCFFSLPLVPPASACKETQATMWSCNVSLIIMWFIDLFIYFWNLLGKTWQSKHSTRERDICQGWHLLAEVDPLGNSPLSTSLREGGCSAVWRDNIQQLIYRDDPGAG